MEATQSGSPWCAKFQQTLHIDALRAEVHDQRASSHRRVPDALQFEDNWRRNGLCRDSFEVAVEHTFRVLLEGRLSPSTSTFKSSGTLIRNLLTAAVSGYLGLATASLIFKEFRLLALEIEPLFRVPTYEVVELEGGRNSGQAR